LNEVSALDELLSRMAQRQAIALRQCGTGCSYKELCMRISIWRERLVDQKIAPCDVVGLRAEFDVEAIALMLALWESGNTVALLPVSGNIEPFLIDAQVDYLFSFDAASQWTLDDRRQGQEKHPLLQRLSAQSRSGFIIFSSGTTGRAKAILHDVNSFLAYFSASSKALRTVAFLLFDHIAGLDTLLYTLASGGMLAIPGERTPFAICQLIEQTAAQVLPASPSFFNLLYLSGDYSRFDLSNLEIVSFGSEPMSESCLARVKDMFPRARLIQKYGSSEFGSPRSRSREGESLWIKMDSDNFLIKVIDGILWVKSPATMLGYLNFESPALEEGYLCTGDRVERDGEWMRILGRDSDSINVGGEKVFPAEVESVIHDFPGVAEVLVYGEANVILGNTVCAKIRPSSEVETKLFKKELRRHCVARLQRYKVPSKIHLVDQSMTGERFKMLRV
jgi:acyl-CoA synthetase (AMP-forming)/AMP-acid ligase II